MPSYQNSDFYDCETNDTILLEPRLVEYIKKKKYFQENEIYNETLDKEFLITSNDMMKIRAYFRKDNNKKSYDPEKYKDFVEVLNSTFPSTDLKKDPRFDRFKIKQQLNKDAKIQRHNYGIISREYDMYRNDRPFASVYGNDFRKSQFHPNEWLNNKKKKKSVSFNETNTYVHPKSIYNGYLAKESLSKSNNNSFEKELTVDNDPYSVDAIIGKLNNYNHTIPKKYNKKDIEINYKSIPCIEKNELKDINIDTYVRFGETPSRKSKSLGYPNPAEHYFEYISPDIQDPDHVVNNRATSSRSFNKKTARL